MEVTTVEGQLVPKATIGRIVLFTFPLPHNRSWYDDEGQSAQVPAIITRVWSDTMVNLTIFVDGKKGVKVRTSVPLKNPRIAESGFFFEWPERV